jgi:hypothetical protein
VHQGELRGSDGWDEVGKIGDEYGGKVSCRLGDGISNREEHQHYVIEGL